MGIDVLVFGVLVCDLCDIGFYLEGGVVECISCLAGIIGDVTVIMLFVDDCVLCVVGIYILDMG